MPLLGAYSFNAWSFAGIALASAVAGLVRGFSGFGSAMVLFPLLSVAVGPAVAAPVTQALDSCLTVPLLPRALWNCAWPEVRPLVIGAVVFVPLGVWLLLIVDGVLLRRIAAGLILAVAAVMAKGWRYARRPTRPMSLGIGALSGVMGGSTTLSGPPVVLFWLGGQADSTTVRANLIVFFALSEVWTLVSYAWSRLYTGATLRLAIALALPFAIGLASGAWCKKFVSERAFRQLALGIVAAAAVVSLVW